MASFLQQHRLVNKLPRVGSSAAGSVHDILGWPESSFGVTSYGKTPTKFLANLIKILISTL